MPVPKAILDSRMFGMAQRHFQKMHRGIKEMPIYVVQVTVIMVCHNTVEFKMTGTFFLEISPPTMYHVHLLQNSSKTISETIDWQMRCPQFMPSPDFNRGCDTSSLSHSDPEECLWCISTSIIKQGIFIFSCGIGNFSVR
jgi:hypothetical protein